MVAQLTLPSRLAKKRSQSQMFFSYVWAAASACSLSTCSLSSSSGRATRTIWDADGTLDTIAQIALETHSVKLSNIINILDGGSIVSL